MRASGTAVHAQYHHNVLPHTPWSGAKDVQDFGSLLSDVVGLRTVPASPTSATTAAAVQAQTATVATPAAQAPVNSSTVQATSTTGSGASAAGGCGSLLSEGATGADAPPALAQASASDRVDPLTAKIDQWTASSTIQAMITTIKGSDNAVMLGISGYTTPQFAHTFTMAGLEQLYQASSWRNTTGIPPGDPTRGDEPLDVQPGPSPFKS
jgi:hypothetical protein